jgi:hypothetical protein
MPRIIFDGVCNERVDWVTLRSYFGDVEQKYQNSSQLCDRPIGVLPVGVVNLPATGSPA